MKSIHFTIILIILAACSNNTEKTKETTAEKPLRKQTRPELQQIIDTANVIGSILIYDPIENIYYSNDFKRCEKGFLPASTFKIPNTVIGLETGVIENQFTVFKWDGKKRRLPTWEKDLTLREAFEVSCVPCYQEVARKIGVKRMNEYLKKLKYGNMIVDSSNIDLFWLEGESKISQYEQIDFLKRFFLGELPISKKTKELMEHVLFIDNEPDYNLYGKTGWAIRNNNNIGWFVGYLNTSKKVYFMATNIEPKEKFNMDMFPIIRSQISLEAFRKLGIIK
ncbi:MAG: class D beta-lactamase [Bacteroidia bacterium]